ncbi:ribonuclease HII [Gemella sp. 19428wG2_WT2a]|nr:ribonuclease HII [Gemella sp. 19428wG2_WT2a]TFU58788.1 ribonuclease HII [Gemella sp. WT2a]
MKISEIKERLQFDNLSQEELDNFRADERVGVQKLVKAYDKKQKAILKEKLDYRARSLYEKKCRELGYKFIAGIDEVGRGPLAGPVVASAVILKEDSYYPGLNDSKKLSKGRREALYEEIIKDAVAYAIVEMDNYQIEKYNIYQATKLAMKKAISNLEVKPDFLLIDAMPLENIAIDSHSIIKGDTKSISIAAASILAKVHRDRLMVEYAKKYPYYDFENNMGYSTKKHLIGLEEYGICPIHRRDFEPIKSMIKKGERNE